MTRRLSEYLEIDAGEVKCRKCGHGLGASTNNWKAAAVVREQPMNGAGGEPYRSGEHVLLRRFFCPGCGRQLSTETALKGDPYLEDVIAAS